MISRGTDAWFIVTRIETPPSRSWPCAAIGFDDDERNDCDDRATCSAARSDDGARRRGNRFAEHGFRYFDCYNSCWQKADSNVGIGEDRTRSEQRIPDASVSNFPTSFCV